MIQPNEFVSGIFDIVGKTVDNVTYSPGSWNEENESAHIHFTDGTTLAIRVSEWFESITLEKPNGNE